MGFNPLVHFCGRVMDCYFRLNEYLYGFNPLVHFCGRVIILLIEIRNNPLESVSIPLCISAVGSSKHYLPRQNNLNLMGFNPLVHFCGRVI